MAIHTDESARSVALDCIDVADNVRELDAAHVQALAGSIALQGLLVPLVVRPAQADDLRLDYAQEELVVESITYTVAGALGLPVDGFAIPYLTSWSEDTDLGVIERAARNIDRLAKRIEDAADISARESHLPAGPVYTQ